MESDDIKIKINLLGNHINQFIKLDANSTEIKKTNLIAEYYSFMLKPRTFEEIHLFSMRNSKI